MTAAEPNAPWRVLVIDDNPLIRDSIVFAAQRLNERLAPTARKLQLFEAEDGATGWDRIVDAKIDLVITDLYIPVMTGLQLIEKIRANPATQNVKVLAISASVSDGRSTSLGAGADSFLQKPMRLIDITSAVTELLKLELK